MTTTRVNIISVNDPPPCDGMDAATVDSITLERFVVLEGGTQSGGLSVAMMGTLPNGRTVFMQTTGTTFAQLAAALKGAYGRFGQTWPGV